MKICLINPYGPLPSEGWRKYRNILLGETLAKEGHDVIWYTSKFSHHFKKNRVGKGYDTGIEKFKVVFIKSKSYKKNISINRLLFELTFCINLYNKLKNENKADLIIAADPSQFVGFLARVLARKKKSKLVLDMMDEWPELFEKALPINKRKYISFIVKQFKRLRKANYQKADGVIALGKNYLDIAKSISKKGIPNELIYNGVDVLKMREWALDDENDTSAFKDKLDSSALNCIYAGSLGMQGNNYDIKAIVSAAEHFKLKNKNVQFYVAGSGEGRNYILDKISTSQLDNIVYLGNLSAEKLARIYSFCDIGLAVYGKGSNVDMPDKFYDYSSCGLVVLSSLTGELKDVILENNIGYYYEAENHTDFIDKISTLEADNKLLEQLKKNSKDVSLFFDQKRQYKKIIKFVNQI